MTCLLMAAGFSLGNFRTANYISNEGKRLLHGDGHGYGLRGFLGPDLVLLQGWKGVRVRPQRLLLRADSSVTSVVTSPPTGLSERTSTSSPRSTKGRTRVSKKQ